MSQTRRENDLLEALQSRRTIGIAIGLTMERFDLDDEEAFAWLARMSTKVNVKVRDLAAHLVKQSNDLRHLSEASQPLSEQRTTLAGLAAADRRGIDATDGSRPLRNLGNLSDPDDVTALLHGL